MDMRTKIALEESILHWKLNEAALDWVETILGANACALCAMFQSRSGCGKCPVRQRTNRHYCVGSPYADVVRARDDWEYVDDFLPGLDDPWHPWLAQWRAREAFKAAARDEIRFLESLREEA